MKTILHSLVASMMSLSLFAQVGIQTDDPKRSLHVNGDLRVRNLVDKSESIDYSKVLVVNSDGDVDFVNKNEFKPIGDEFTADKQVLNNIYTMNTNSADDSKFVSCGKFDFAFRNNGSNTNIRFRLLTAPAENESVTVYTTLEQNWQAQTPTDTNGGYEFQSPANQGRVFNSTNAFVDLPTSGAQIVSGELNILYLLYPGDSDLYRLTFYRLDQPTIPPTYDFVTACEKF